MNKRCCIQCHGAFTPIRNLNQRYCSQKTCQNARKRKWRKEKRTKDPDYRENQRVAQNKWRIKTSEYWKNYREAHPEYVEINRQKQKIRDLKRIQVNASHLAKSDALTEILPIKSGTYKITFLESHLAKSDALMAKISLIT